MSKCVQILMAIFYELRAVHCNLVFEAHRTMHLFFIYTLLFYISSIHCYDSESFETNGIEVTPFYDTIIFSDIADIINEFENDAKPVSDINSESEIDENIEDLLSEYQHYLNRAHKQKQIYIKKTKNKNKSPLSHDDNFNKTKTIPYNNDSFRNNYFNPNLFKFPQSQYNSPLDFVLPLNFKPRHPTVSKVISEVKDIRNTDPDKTIDIRKQIIDLETSYDYLDRIKPSCFCKTPQIQCKQCLIPFKPFTENSYDIMKMSDNKKSFPNPADIDGLFKAPQYNIVDKVNNIQDNILNVTIKVDFSIPKIQNNFGQNILDNMKKYEDLTKETPAKLNMPLSYYNFPIPLNMFGYKKFFKTINHDFAPLHKLTVQKKNKSIVNKNSNKNHKQLIAFHNIKHEPHQFFSMYYGNNEVHNKSKNIYETIVTSTTPNVTEKTEHNILVTRMPNNTSINKNYTHEKNDLTVNITNNEVKTTEDSPKNENSIENEFTQITSEKLSKLRLKRNTDSNNLTSVHPKNNGESQKPVAKVLKITKDLKRNDKNLLKDDTELLYWPNNYEDQTGIQTKNITALTLMRENNKLKLNISTESIRRNHTQALEKAIFGDVDWNDVDTVAPAFMSFVGKYIRGVLTFCSQNICHSMKCADKTCVHRTCAPSDRLNNKGHCAGSKYTDSVASMESIMDLPSNIAFEIVDILHGKMLGKIFGKMTLCITSKCISMAASKKIFKKTKCSIKELYSSGHCPDLKSVQMP